MELSLYGAPCSSVTTCVSICIPISRCHLGDKFEFQWRCKSRVPPAIPGPPSTRTNRKADFAAVVYGLFVSAGVGREGWHSPLVTGKPNQLTGAALLAFLSIQPISWPREAAISLACLPTPAALALALPCSHSHQLLQLGSWDSKLLLFRKKVHL